jgi:hypothetical protein
MEPLRRVQFKNDDGDMEYGYFHCWGEEIKDTVLGKQRLTVGIIEDEDKNIHGIFPRNVKFQRRPHEEEGWKGR